MATPAWFNEVQYLNGKLAQLQNKSTVDAEKDPNGVPYTNISQVSDAIKAAGLTAFEHYDMYGSKENINPSSAFNAEEYCLLKLRQLQATGTDAEKAAWAGSTWQEVQFAIHKAGLSVAGHYGAFGAGEGVPMSNSFDTNAYLTAKLDALIADTATAAAWKGKTVADVAKAISGAGMDPYTHYMTYGGKANEVASGQTFEVADPVHPSGGDGKTFNFTTGVDSFNGTAANDTFNAVVYTLAAGDFADGAAGWDTLNLYQNTSLTGVTLKNIEEVKSFADQGNLDLTRAPDVQKFWAIDSSARVTANVDQQVGFEGDVATLDASGDAIVTTVTFKSADTDGEVAKVALKNADFGSGSGGNLTIAGDIETVSFDLAGKNKFDADAVLNVGKTANLAFTGAGSLETEISGNAATLASIDASKATGDLSLDVDAAAGNLAKAFAYTGSAGADDLLVSGSSVAKTLTIDLGAGDNELSLTGAGTGSAKGSTFKAGDGKNDSLTLDSFGTINKAEGAKFTGFEHLTLGGTTSYNVGDIAGLTTYALEGAATVSISKLANNETVAIVGTSAAATVTLNVDSTVAGGETNLNLTFDNGSDVAASGAEITTLNTTFKQITINSAGNVEATASGDANLLKLASGNAFTASVIIGGDEDFTFAADSATKLGVVNGSAAKGDLNINVSAVTLVGDLKITGGEGNDTITSSASGDTIFAGKGVDRIQLTGTAALDTIRFDAGDSKAENMDIVDNFLASSDMLDLRAYGFTGANANIPAAVNTDITVTVANTSDVDDINAGITFTVTAAKADTLFASSFLAMQNFTAAGAGTFAGGTSGCLILIDADKNGKWDATTDDAIIVVGSDVTAANMAGNVTFV